MIINISYLKISTIYEVLSVRNQLRLFISNVDKQTNLNYASKQNKMVAGFFSISIVSITY